MAARLASLQGAFTRLLAALTLVVAVVAGGCGGRDETTRSTAGSTLPETVTSAVTPEPAPTDAPVTTTTPATTSATPTSAVLPATPNPLHVAVELDDQSAVTVFVPTEGGSLSAVAGDGTVFSLDIPAGALMTPQDITLTPVSLVDGLPLSGGLTAAAHLAPEGLRLLQPATLRIEPLNAAAGIAAGFAFEGTGSEFHLHPVVLDDADVTMELRQFSGYGTGGGTEADIASQLERVPTSPAHQASQAVAGIALQSGASSGTGAAGLPAAARNSIEDALREWWQQSVKPRLENAQAGALLLDDAVDDYIAWWVAVKTEGLEQAFAAEDAEARDLLTTALANGIDGFARQCRQQNAPENVPFILRWWNLSVHLGLSVGYPTQDIVAIVEDCASFILSFESTVVIESGPVAGTTQVAATVPLVPEPGLSHWKGSGPIEYTDLVLTFPSPPPNCSISWDGIGSTMSVPFAWLNLDVWAGAPDLRVVIDPGRPKELMTATCVGVGGGSQTLEQDAWVGNFALMHLSEFHVDSAGVESGIRISGFGSSGHMSFVKVYDNQATFGGVLVTEKSTIAVSPG